MPSGTRVVLDTNVLLPSVGMGSTTARRYADGWPLGRCLYVRCWFFVFTKPTVEEFDRIVRNLGRGDGLARHFVNRLREHGKGEVASGDPPAWLVDGYRNKFLEGHAGDMGDWNVACAAVIGKAAVLVTREEFHLKTEPARRAFHERTGVRIVWPGEAQEQALGEEPVAGFEDGGPFVRFAEA